MTDDEREMVHAMVAPRADESIALAIEVAEFITNKNAAGRTPADLLFATGVAVSLVEKAMHALGATTPGAKSVGKKILEYGTEWGRDNGSAEAFDEPAGDA